MYVLISWWRHCAETYHHHHHNCKQALLLLRGAATVTVACARRHSFVTCHAIYHGLMYAHTAEQDWCGLFTLVTGVGISPHPPVRLPAYLPASTLTFSGAEITFQAYKANMNCFTIVSSM